MGGGESSEMGMKIFGFPPLILYIHSSSDYQTKIYIL